MKQPVRFCFEGYKLQTSTNQISFHYSVYFSDNTQTLFTEKLTFPENASWDKIPNNILKSSLESLHLILGISYWKAYCPKELILKNLVLNKKQAEFWNTVYTKGLGEFFYRNSIDFRGLVQFPHAQVENKAGSFSRQNRSLLPFGGGKDSIVALELLKKAGKDFTLFTLGTSPVQEEVSQKIGQKPLVVQRELDSQLFDLNSKGEVYNGHVPISAVYHLVGSVVALLFDYKYIVFPNELSASYGNVNYLGVEINHQWSKSFEFEKLVQDYIHQFITPDIMPFSLLRPLHEIKIVELFSHMSEYFSTFSSCNRNFTQTKGISQKRWCGECPKCAFVFLLLAAFLPKEKVLSIFSKNLLSDPKLTLAYKELLGLKDVKPWDCVGTPEEVQLAFYLAHQKGEFEKDTVMKMFVDEVLPTLENPEKLKEKLLIVTHEGSVPEEFKIVIEELK